VLPDVILSAICSGSVPQFAVDVGIWPGTRAKKRSSGDVRERSRGRN